MSASQRVTEFLRQFRRQTSVDTSVILSVWTDPEAEAVELRPDDLDTVIAEAELWDEGVVHLDHALAILRGARSATRASDILFNTEEIDDVIDDLERAKGGTPGGLDPLTALTVAFAETFIADRGDEAPADMARLALDTLRVIR